MRTFTTIAAGVALLSSVAVAHPHETSPELQARKFDLSKRCAPSVAAMNKKRWAKRNEKHLAGRDTNTTVAIHTEAPYYDVLQNETCILTEEVTTGPYIWPQSQTLRQDMTEDQAGVPMLLDIGVMDVETCEPLDDVLVDIWYCNATGSYSSFSKQNPDTPFEELLEQLNKTIGDDLHTDDTTFLRAHWPTDSNGIVEFTGIVPGFYVERAIHIHVQVHTDWTIRANGTVASSTTVSTGQVFINETLSAQLMALEPYASHTTINRTTNDVDDIFASETANGWDPTLQIVPLDGEDIANGIIGYVTIGVDTSTQQRMRREVLDSKI
ncbi:hypothetical protein SLS64_003015 [Diaporthe eres]